MKKWFWIVRLLRDIGMTLAGLILIVVGMNLPHSVIGLTGVVIRVLGLFCVLYSIWNLFETLVVLFEDP